LLLLAVRKHGAGTQSALPADLTGLSVTYIYITSGQELGVCALAVMKKIQQSQRKKSTSAMIGKAADATDRAACLTLAQVGFELRQRQRF
jgi:hypothetical protein